MKPGIYDISNEAYHSSPGISRSGLMLFKKSPMHYWDKYLNPNREPEKEKSHYKFGSALHVSVLEPDIFNKNYVVLPKIDRRTKAGKNQWEIWQVEHAGKEIITDIDYEKIMRITESIRKDEYAYELINGATYERSIYWNEKNLLCKIKPDIMHDNAICDLKSTTDASEENFPYSAEKYGYFLQAAMLKIGFESVTNKKIKEMAFIAFEKEPPYCSHVFFLDEGAIDEGVENFYKLLEIYEEAYDKNEWKSYPPSILYTPRQLRNFRRN